MKHEKLTDKIIAACAKAAKKITVLRDSEVRGFYFRFDPQSGRGRWHVQGDQPRFDLDGLKSGKRSISITLGMAYPPKEQELTPAAARKLAGELKRQIIAGDTFTHGGKMYAPIDQRAIAEKQREVRKQMQVLAKRSSADLPLEKAMTEYLKKYPRKHETLHRQFVSAVQTHFGDYMQQPVTAITDAVIDGWYEPTHSKHKAAMHLRGILRYCAEERVPRVIIDPQVFVQIRVLGKRYNTQTRTVRHLEIKEHMLPIIWQEAEAVTPAIWSDVIRLCAYTGLRKSEACSLQWSQVDFSDRSFKIEKPKNGKAMALPMSDQVEELLRTRYENRADGIAGKYVFGSDRFATQHPTRYSGSKTLTAWQHACRVGLQNDVSVGLHQLRKFARHTLASKLRCPETLTDAIMNQQPKSVGASNYADRFDVEPKREPLQQLADHIDALVSGAAQ